ncbi:formate/nitrite transporter family protein [Patulibacter sp. SYSU D01012]|uniref:formate/nitrite transporter family protein n=1 Tax=Patulibacter sp. SYSU D01012 TaxID=2817381 RepID=UPI001B309BD8|nr:formate/nitrite transporter family protein [Patulibacter sp. SYSU D01012]
MAAKTPAEIAATAAERGAEKAALPASKLLVGGFLAGAYIAFAGMLAITVSAGLDPKIWGTLPTFFTGAVFSLGLILVIIAGSELLTGNMALVPIAALARRVGVGRVAFNFAFVAVGNLLGSLFVAYFLAVKSGVLTAELPLARLDGIATAKGVTEGGGQIFLRALGCNWLVCLAVWMALAADDVGGKILAIFFPIMGFVAMGFDHVVANMFFLPAAIFAGVDGVSWWDTIHNWIFAFLGNLVGGAVFVAGAYWFLHLRGRDPQATAVAAGHPDAPPGRAGGPDAARRPPETDPAARIEPSA